MPRQQFAMLLFFLCVLFSPALVYAKSQAMSPQQYAEFINKLDAAASSWQDRIKRLDATMLPLDAERRQRLYVSGLFVIQFLDKTKDKVFAEREHPSLSLEITMSDTLTAVSVTLMQLIAEVPDSPAKKAWVDAVMAIQNDISAYAGPLHEHVLNKAYDLEFQIWDCQAQLKKQHH